MTKLWFLIIPKRPSKFEHSHVLVECFFIQLHIDFLFLSCYFWPHFFWEWVDSVADSGRTRYHCSSAGILRSISVRHCLSLRCLRDAAELQLQSVCHHDASHQKEKDIKMFGKGEDFQHSKLAWYAGYLRLYKPAGNGGVVVVFAFCCCWNLNMSTIPECGQCGTADEAEVQAIHRAELRVLEAHTPSLFTSNLLSIWD